MDRIIIPGKLKGRIDAPSSKSMSQRALLLAAFLPGHKRIGPISGCDDENIALDVCKATGMRVIKDGNYYNIYGDFSTPESVNVGESGTTMRLILGLMAARKCRCEIETEGILLERPLKPLIEVLESVGCRFSLNGNRLFFDGSNAQSVSEIHINGEQSSQFTSSLMFYMALNPTGKKIIHIEGKMTSSGYIQMTASILKKLALKVKIEGQRIEIDGILSEMNSTLEIEGDYSSAAFMIAAGLLFSEDGIEIGNLDENSLQPDRNVLYILNDVLNIGNSTVHVKKQDIPTELMVDVDLNPDLAPVIALLGMFSRNGCLIKNPDRLSGKESNRKEAIIEIAGSFGCPVMEDEKGLFIGSREDNCNPVIPLSKDHRIIMLSILALAAVSDKFVVYNSQFLGKSYPSFIDDLISLGFSEESE